MSRRSKIAFDGLVAAFAFGALASAAFATGTATPLESVDASPDIAVSLPGGLVEGRDVAAIVLLDGSSSVIDLGSLPAGSRVSAYHRRSATQHLFSLDIPAALGGVTAWPDDVVHYDSGTATYSLEFDGGAAGLPQGAAINAVGETGGGLLLLSFDTTLDLGGGLVADDEDLVSWDGSAFALVLDGSALGLPAGTDLDAVSALSETALLFSLDVSTQFGLDIAHDEDVVELDTASGFFSLAWDASASDAAWGPADLQALDATADPDGDGIPAAQDNCPDVNNPDQLNFDGDAEGDACDADDDNDGTADVSDAFPFDHSEWTDTDGDGIGNNADLDDDNDGLPDALEAAIFYDPLSSDGDGNGMGDFQQIVALVQACVSEATPALTPPGVGVLVGLLTGLGIAGIMRRRIH